MLDLVPANIYQKIFQADLNQSLSIPDSYYDHALCVGTFTYGHVKANAFAEFHRILKMMLFLFFQLMKVYMSRIILERPLLIMKN
jgi:ubiquinone/menaquinone biosynthesis C-methylase UbiE